MLEGTQRPSATGRRLLLLTVAALLTLAATLAIGILLFGDFGETEGRILGTTALLAAYSLLALPAAVLLDRRRLPGVAAAVVVLAVAAAAVTITALWWSEPPETLGRAIGTANAWLVASVQIAALAARRRPRDPRVVRRLFAVSTPLVCVLAALLSVVIWAELDSERVARVFGALLVLDVLLVVLQPLLARTRPAGAAYRVRAVVASGETVDLDVEAADLASAAARAVRTLERDGRPPLRLELTGAGADADAALAGARANGRAPGEPLAGARR